MNILYFFVSFFLVTEVQFVRERHKKGAVTAFSTELRSLVRYCSFPLELTNKEA